MDSRPVQIEALHHRRNYDNRPGRTWRDIQDAATAAQILYAAGGGWDNWRLNVDYYDDEELIWLDVDTTIRRLTNGKKTLDDFVADRREPGYFKIIKLDDHDGERYPQLERVAGVPDRLDDILKPAAK